MPTSTKRNAAFGAKVGESIPSKISRLAVARQLPDAGRMRTTLRQVAARARVSKSTVSLVVRNDPRVAPATRAKVQRWLERLDYRPDPALAKLAAHRWRSRRTDSGSAIAYVSLAAPDAPSVPSLRAEGARERATALGYGFEHHRLAQWKPPGALARVLFARGVQGVVLGRSTPWSTALPGAPDWQRFSVAACGLGFDRPPFPTVVPDFFAATRDLFARLRAAGRRRIGLAVPVFAVHGHRLSENDALKFAAGYFELGQLGPAGLPPLVYAHEDSAGFVGWVRTHRPDALVLGISTPYWWLRDAGITHVQLLTLTWSAGTEQVGGYAMPEREMGAAAVDLLHAEIVTGQRGAVDRRVTMLQPMRWHEPAAG